MATVAQIRADLVGSSAVFRTEMVRAASQANESMAVVRASTTAAAQSLSMLNSAAAGFVGFQAVKAGVNSLIEAQVSIQQIHYGLVAATGSAKQAADGYAYVQKIAQQMGLDLQSSAQGFAQLAASASANNITMAQTQELFTAFAKASTVMHLSTEQSNRALLALEQMFSKGKIQAQELRLQLGQAIPGAAARFQNAVLEMNKGTDLAGKSLDDLLKDGDLVTSKYMPALVTALTETGRGWEQASNGLNAQLNRLRSEWFKVRAETSSGLFDTAATGSVKYMADNLRELTGVATAAAAAVGLIFLGRGVQSGVGFVHGITASIAGARAEAEAVALATAAKVAEAEQNVVSTAMRAREMAQRKALAAGMVEQAGTQNEVTAATARYSTVATQAARANAAYQSSITRLSAAQAANAEAQAAAAATQGLGAANGLIGKSVSGISGLVGGTFGIVTLLVGGLGYAMYDLVQRTEQARKAFKDQADQLGDTRSTLEATISGYKNGSVSLRQVAEAWNAGGVEVRKADADMANLQRRIAALQAMQAEAARNPESGSHMGLTGVASDLRDAQTALAGLQAQVDPVRRRFLEMGDQLKQALGPKLFAELQDAAQKADNIKFAKLRGQLSDVKAAALEAAEAIADINKSAGDQVFRKQVEYIKKTQGEFAAWQVEQGKKINDAGGVAKMTPEQRAQFNQTAAAMKQFIDLNNQFDASKKAANASHRSAVSYAKQEANQYSTIIDSIKQRIATDKEALQQDDKMTEEQKFAIKIQTELASAKNKIPEASKKIIEANLAELLSLGQMRKEMDETKKAAEELARLKQQLNVDFSNQQERNRSSLLGMYSGANHAEQMRREFEIDKKYADELKTLRDKGYTHNSESYKAQLAELNSFHQQALAEEQRYQDERVRMQSDWRNGAVGAMEDYSEKAQDVAGMTKGVMSNAFSGMEDMVGQFVTTGKANFADFAKSVIADFAKMETRILLSKVFQYIMQAWGGGGGSGGVSMSADYGGSNYAGAYMSANGSAWNGGVQFFANGGVFDSPTSFRHAGGLGVLGEAGPEAVMPLAKGSNGKLGVQLVGGGGGGVSVSITQTFQIEGGKGGAGGADSKAASDFSKAMDQQMRQTALQVINEEQRQGGSLWRMQHA